MKAAQAKPIEATRALLKRLLRLEWQGRYVDALDQISEEILSGKALDFVAQEATVTTASTAAAADTAESSSENK